jgi:hypothetical protein
LPRLFFAPGHDLQGQPTSIPAPYGQSFGPGQPLGSGQQTGPGQQFGQQSGQPPGLGQGLGPRPGGGPPPGGGRLASRPPAGPRPVRPRPTRPPDRELRHRAIASLIFGILALVALFGLSGSLSRGVYLLIFSAVIGIAGCVIGITAVLKARKTGSYRPRGAVGGIVLGVIATLLSIPILATYLAFPHQVDNYVRCLSQSQQPSGSQQACMNRFYKSIHLGSAELGVWHHAPGLAQVADRSRP